MSSGYSLGDAGTLRLALTPFRYDHLRGYLQAY